MYQSPNAKYMSYTKFSKSHRALSSKITNSFVLGNIEEALGDMDWKLAVLKEMNALKRSGTWEVVDLSKDKKIGCKWVFTFKCKADESIE